MKTLYLILIFVLIKFSVSFGQLGFIGHQPGTLIPYNAAPYSFQPYMRQYSQASEASNKIYNAREARLFVNFNFDTSGKNVYAVYTTDGSNPNKSNGSVSNCGFSTFTNPDRLWSCTIPTGVNVTGTELKYIFYISDGSLANGWGRIDGQGGNQYLTTWNESSVQPFQYTVLNDNTTFPVELVNFFTINNSNSITLKWNTDSEVNNDYFEIQRSSDALKFNSLGKVEGIGTTQETSSYEFTDKNPFKGNNYYRLKQVDLGGKYKFSKIISAYSETGSSPYMMYPNPVNEVMRISDFEKIEKIEIINNTGKVNLIEIKPEINTEKLASGVYILKITKTDGSVMSERFIKL